MSIVPIDENIVLQKICSSCGTSFHVTDKDLEFYERVSPVFDGRSFPIPEPGLCRDCRQQKRLIFRNERKLYRRTCDATGEEIISMYSPDKPFKVYNQKEWWSDKWSPLDFGMDYDSSRGFFEQFRELQKKVPRLALMNKNSENAQFNNFIAESRNCYMSFRTYYNCEDIYYSYRTMFDSKDIFDSFICRRSENCYELIDGNDCYGCSYGILLYGCSDCHYSFNLTGCRNCFMCSDLTNKEYHFKNKALSKDEYENTIGKYMMRRKKNDKDIMKEYDEIVRNAIRKNLSNYNCENVSGDYLQNSKNAQLSFNCINCNDIKYCVDIDRSNDSYDVTGGGGDHLYESVAIDMSDKALFCNVLWGGHDLYYSEYCLNSSDVFGCIGLRDSQYCILNKQYTKEEYEKTVAKILDKMILDGEWGYFFPADISPFGYNETVAQEYYPLGKNDALWRGFSWSEYEPPFPKVDKIIPADKLPDNIDDVPDDILNWAIECEITKKPFRIIKKELEFYRKNSLPIPRKHPDQRHLERLSKKNPKKLFIRNCDRCSISMETSYSPERPEKVYCEECYEKSIQ